MFMIMHRLLFLLLPAAALVPLSRFQVHDKILEDGEAKIEAKVLLNTENGEHATVLSGWGGKLELLQLVGKEGLRDVIYNHNGNATLIQKDSSPGAVLCPFSNRVANGTYTWNGKTHYLNRNSANNAIHGFLIGGQPMEVAQISSDDSHAAVTLSYTFGGEEGYPFNVSFELTYTLDSNGLQVKGKAENIMADRSAPFMLGLHPYFKVKDVSKTVVTFDQCSKWNHVDVTPAPDLIPIGTTTPVKRPFDGSSPIGGNITHPTHFDDGFKAISSRRHCPKLTTKIRDDQDVLKLWMDDSFRFLQIYTGAPDKGVAVEPQAGETDCWNNKDSVIALQAGEIWEGSFGFSIEAL